MKPYYRLIIIALAVSLYACSEVEQAEQTEPRGPEVTDVVAMLDDKNADVNTRAIADYAVNKEGKDPTKTKENLSDRTDWLLDVQIYKGDDVYADGKVTGCIYDTSDAGKVGRWKVPSNSLIYFPNYTKQKIALTLRPAAWTVGATTIAETQNTKKLLLAQDVLKEKDLATKYNPAHIIIEPPVLLKHTHSMIDFILKDIAESEIDTVEVKVGNITYAPYAVTPKKEYLLILPPDTKVNPVIHVTTTAGKKYIQSVTLITDKRTEYGENNCYCFTLQGVELKISPITIADWATGEAISGDYVGVTEYPTFRGPANTSCELYYDNNLVDGSGIEIWQTLTFNSRGECTVKPFGRKIIKIKANSKPEKTIEVILGDMIVDLNTALTSFWP